MNDPPRTVLSDVDSAALDEALAAAVEALRTYATEPRGEVALTPAQAAIRVLDVAAPILVASGRTQAAADIRQATGWYPEDVFPADSDNRSAIAGTAMRHAYEQAAQIAESGHRD